MTEPGEQPIVEYNEVGPGDFATMGIPLLAGREISWQDDAAAPKVAVINETMARRFFTGKSALGLDTPMFTAKT